MANDWDAEVARGLREYHEKHGRASDAVAMPREVLEQLAAIQPVNEDQEYGPGRVVCPACGEWMSMRWSSGARLDEAADMAHNVYCPAVWARNALAHADASEPLRRLWPLIEHTMNDYVFTGDKAGEMAADMAALRRSLGV